MPEFNVGDEVVFVGGPGYLPAEEAAKTYSYNGRTFIVDQVNVDTLSVWTCRGHRISAPFSIWRHAGPPETVRAISNKVYQEYIKCM